MVFTKTCQDVYDSDIFKHDYDDDDDDDDDA